MALCCHCVMPGAQELRYKVNVFGGVCKTLTDYVIVSDGGFEVCSC